MLKKTTIAVTAAALMLGAACSAQAAKDSSNNSGDYTGGALFGPLPGQIFSYGPGAAYYGYGYAYAPGRRGGRVLIYAPTLREEFPNAPWDTY